MIQVFVYGTLKPGGRYYQQYCVGRVLAEHPAKVRGFLYDLPMGYPAMVLDGWSILSQVSDDGQLPNLNVQHQAMCSTADQADGSWVHGYVLTLAEPDLLIALDALEGYDPQGLPETNHYDRCWVTAWTPEGLPLGQVWVYVMSPEAVDRYQGVAVPGGCWRDATLA